AGSYSIAAKLPMVRGIFQSGAPSNWRSGALVEGQRLRLGSLDPRLERTMMKTVFSPLHAGHAGQMELIAGEIVPGFEKPSRAEFIRARVESEKLGEVLAPAPHSLDAAKRVHRADYIDFLPTVWPLWQEAGLPGSAMG